MPHNIEIGVTRSNSYSARNLGSEAYLNPPDPDPLLNSGSRSTSVGLKSRIETKPGGPEVRIWGVAKVVVEVIQVLSKAHRCLPNNRAKELSRRHFIPSDSTPPFRTPAFVNSVCPASETLAYSLPAVLDLPVGVSPSHCFDFRFALPLPAPSDVLFPPVAGRG
jgi:hypothetical protein